MATKKERKKQQVAHLHVHGKQVNPWLIFFFYFFFYFYIKKQRASLPLLCHLNPIAFLYLGCLAIIYFLVSVYFNFLSSQRSSSRVCVCVWSNSSFNRRRTTTTKKLSKAVAMASQQSASQKAHETKDSASQKAHETTEGAKVSFLFSFLFFFCFFMVI